MIDFIKKNYSRDILRYCICEEPSLFKTNVADREFVRIVSKILNYGTMDVNPRPHYSDGTPAHTISINHESCTFDLSNNEFPIITLRPIPFKSAIGELLWIYQDQSNKLDILKNKYNVSWWDNWDIGDGTIGACYGETVRRHDLMNKLLNGIKNDPDGRRHIISLWQEDDFNMKHGLKPCCFLTNWNVRHEEDGDYLDMCLYQRSADFAVGVMSNWVQYATFLHIVAYSLNYKPGKFTWFCANVQIYDRHVDQCIEMIKRPRITSTPTINITTTSHNFYDITMNDIKLVGYPLDKIKETNPQLNFPIGI